MGLPAVQARHPYRGILGCLMKRFCWWDGSLWWRTYTPGGFDGYRTLRCRKLPCATMETALRRPDMHDDIRRVAARRAR